jgi:predicted N-acetyltransferase YhbS
MITILSHEEHASAAVVHLFASTFAAAEGEEEGAVIGALVRDLMTTDPSDLFGYVASRGERLAGAIFFSRMQTDGTQTLFLLSPVAVRPEAQGQGIGQRLITHGLQQMREHGADVVITYGDPAFYGKVGFEPLSTEDVPPPFELSQPIGWLGTSLSDDAIRPVRKPVACVAAFDEPGLW